MNLFLWRYYLSCMDSVYKYCRNECTNMSFSIFQLFNFFLHLNAYKPLKNNTSTPNPSVSKIHFNLAEICFHNIVYNINVSSFSSSSLGSSLSSRIRAVQSCSCKLFYIKAQDNSRCGGALGRLIFNGRPSRTQQNRVRLGGRGTMDNVGVWRIMWKKCALTRWKEEKIRWYHCCFHFIFQW